MKSIKAFLLAITAGTLSATAQVTGSSVTVHDDRTGSDEVIGLPEGMTVSTDSLTDEWMARKYLFPDTTCVNSDYNPTFTAEEYQERLRRLPVLMEMPYNSIVQKFIDQYTGRLRGTVAYALGAGNFYIPIFEEALDYYGLPLELKYLPVIESGLQPKAKSHAGAVGLWQFMLSAAKRYDLTVNSLVDERQDPYKSSWAAARLLRDLYKIYGDWSLVIAAYNCGPGNVNKAIHRAGGARDYWTIYPYLPSETRGYVPAFIAANYVMHYYCEHNICPMKTKMPVTTDTVTVTRDLHIDQVAAVCGIEKEAVRTLNPQYRTDLIPGSTGPMTLCLPTEQLMTFIDMQDSVYNYQADRLLTRRATVEVNAGNASVNAKSGTATASKKKATKKKTYSKKSKTRTKSKSRSRRSATTTVVRKGDSLYEIAKRHGTTVENLRKKNKLKGNLIKPGDKLRVK